MTPPNADTPDACPIGGPVADLEHGKRIMEWQAEHAPKAGAPAPLLTLPLADGSGDLSMASLLAEKPVALILGSFT
ncbi:MAG: hypothetical protein ACYTGX_15265 [Planctomycetota bacterium]|jgi:hypothetical protein